MGYTLRKSPLWIQTVFSSFWIIAFPAWDYHMGWSSVPIWLSIATDVLVLVGFVVVFYVFKANTFTSGAIEHMKSQRTITNGPYTVVRHPMYSGAALIIVASPLALGSYWGLIFSMLLIVIIVHCLLDEKALLNEELEGYSDYCKKQPYRLVPFIW